MKRFWSYDICRQDGLRMNSSGNFDTLKEAATHAKAFVSKNPSMKVTLISSRTLRSYASVHTVQSVPN